MALTKWLRTAFRTLLRAETSIEPPRVYTPPRRDPMRHLDVIMPVPPRGRVPRPETPLQEEVRLLSVAYLRGDRQRIAVCERRMLELVAMLPVDDVSDDARHLREVARNIEQGQHAREGK